MKFKNIFYMLKLSAIGGTESFLYYLSRYLKDSDITIMYKIGDSTQVNRLRQYARVIKWESKFETERIECDKIFYNYFTEIAQFVDAKEHIQVLPKGVTANYADGSSVDYEGSALISPGLDNLVFNFTTAFDSANAISFVDESGNVVDGVTVALADN